MGRNLRGTIVAVMVMAATLGVARPAAAGFSDVPSGHWARPAILYVAQQHSWMRDFGTTEFRPRARLTRRHLARATVRAFARSEPTDPGTAFPTSPRTIGSTGTPTWP